MYKVWMDLNGVDYLYGTYSNQLKANEIALHLKHERNVQTFVEKC